MSSSLTPVIDFLRRHAPFEQMAAAHLEFMAKRLSLGFYARGEVILSPSDGAAKRLYIIKQGRVRGETVDGDGSDSAWELVTGEAFPVGALLSHRPTHMVQRAAEDTFCFELERDDFDRLIAQSEVFHDFCTRRIANLLDNALRSVQAHSATRISEENPLSTPLHSLVRRTPVTCSADTPLSDALQLMEQESVGSIAITNEKNEFRGILTLHDLLGRIILPQRPLSTPISEVMTKHPLALPASTLSWEAALVMAREGFGHLGVLESNKLIGIVSERDLFALQRIRLVNLSRNINHAADVATLRHLQEDIHRLVEQMLAQGASVDQITRIITALNDSTTQRVITLVLTEVGHPSTPFTWLAFGSEGRHEQTLKTDQDNGIIFNSVEGRSDEQIRIELLPIAQKINDALAECGFPLCGGNIMARNPDCCLSLDEWKNKFANWMYRSDSPELLNATIFFDFRPLYGPDGPAQELRQWLLNKVRDQRLFLRRMSANALANEPPLGVVRDFVVISGGEHPHTIDLKINGITPFVDAARIFSLAAGIAATNTEERLRNAGMQWHIEPAEVEAWIGAFLFIQLLRLRMQHEQGRRGEKITNNIDPYLLNELEQRILKESFRQARKLQGLLDRYYKF